MTSRVSAASVVLLFFLSSAVLSAQNATDLYARGKRALERDDYYTAIELFKSSVDVNGNYYEPLVGLAESYFALSEYNEALRYIEKARFLDRFNTVLAVMEGRIHLGLGQFEEAEKIFESVLKTEPHNIDAQFGLAELSIAFRKPANAAFLYERALRISPQNRRALLSLVLVFDEMGDFELSSTYLQQVLDYYPQDATVHYIAAKHMAVQQRYSDAVFHAKVALSVNPEYLDATLLLSRIHLIRKEFDDAIVILEKVLSDFGDEPLIWYNLATAYARADRTDDAIQAYARVFTIRPDDEVARVSLENLLLANTEIGDPRRDRFAQYHFDRGESYYERNYLREAMQEFRRGLVLSPRSRDGRLLYASTYRSLGFEGKYLSELRVLHDLGYGDREISNKIEIAESLQKDSVSWRWDIAQYDLVRDRYRVAVYLAESQMLHMYGDEEVADYFYHLLLSYDKIDLAGPIVRSSGFGSAYRDARGTGADFFVIVQFDEGTRHFAAEWSLFSASTGAQLAEYGVLRTGNNRVGDGSAKAAEMLVQKFPLYAEILAREFDLALIDAGWVDGLAIDDELVILKRETIERTNDSLQFDYTEEDILGVITLTGVDELVSEGSIDTDPFFDLINVGDRVIYPPVDQGTPRSMERPIPDDLYRAILKIR